MPLTTRAGKGAPLNATEHDENLTHVMDRGNHTGTQTASTISDFDAEIETAYNAQVATVSQVDAEAGTSTTVFRWTPERVGQAIAALASGGGSSIEVEDEGVSLTTTVTKINFVGAGVTASEPVAGEIDVTVAGGSAPVDSVNGATGAVVLDADDIDDTATANKFATAGQLTKVDNISAFGESLVGDANATAARATLSVDAAGTDNSTDVTLAGSPDYITISGQTITRNQIDLSTDVAGELPAASVGVVTPNVQSGTSYTPVLSDGNTGLVIYMDNAAAKTFTVPLDSAVAFPLGTVLNVVERGAGVLTIDVSSGATLNSVADGSAAINTRGQGVSIQKLATNSWHMVGDHDTVA